MTTRRAIVLMAVAFTVFPALNANGGAPQRRRRRRLAREWKLADEKRRAALTPEQRAAEDVERAAAYAAQQAEVAKRQAEWEKRQREIAAAWERTKRGLFWTAAILVSAVAAIAGPLAWLSKNRRTPQI